jgi:6-pyruvoyltetrahydropterin/6-carboxytetrahydropterin synthase
MTYSVTKRYGHQEGWACVFRQHRATHSHCQLLHGYAMAFELTFASETLNELNWVLDFGGLKGIKSWLQMCFDHRTIIAEDDPDLPTFRLLHNAHLINLAVLPGVGCEKFAEYIYKYVAEELAPILERDKIHLVSVKVQEHEGNSATYFGGPSPWK